MKLLLPKVIQTLTEHRVRLELIPKMVKAEKFIFSSASDEDEELVEAVRSTTEEMIDWNLLHLPSKLIWVEDLVRPEHILEQSPEAETLRETMRKYNLDVRYCYLAEEFEDRIEMRLLRFAQNLPGSPTPYTCEHYGDDFGLISLRPDRAPVTIINGVSKDSNFALRDLLATLATPQAHKERLEVSQHNETKPITMRNYSHTIVRVQLSAPSTGPKGVLTDRRKAQEFVRGYIWGKHTRTRDKQKFIKPYFRGDEALGRAKPKDHYEVEHI